MKKNNHGQGMIEAVIAIGLLGLVLTGVVSLLISTMSSRNQSFERKKAAELASLVMERIYTLKNNDPDTFWAMTDENGKTDADYSGYTYDVKYTDKTGSGGNCDTPQNCVQVTVTVKWRADSSKSYVIEKFMTRR
jgi:Tfp pilus assembly protein PilV